jgi:hypothetical protein
LFLVHSLLLSGVHIQGGPKVGIQHTVHSILYT